MTTTTQVVWAPNTPTQEQIDAQKTYVDTLVAQGATDGTYQSTDVPQGRMITRHWTTVNDATTWITYIADFGPISAEIIE